MTTDRQAPLFLISQPRSGSTLLQRTLAAHPQIHTTSEPWIMLHPLRALEEGAFHADHDAKYAHLALTGFLDNIEGGMDRYYEAVRRFGEHLYAAALEGTGATLFLDKTPRYYLILDRLVEVFPESKFILLVRNPAAVLGSVYRTWVRPNLLTIRRYRRDLLEAPSRIVAAREALGDRAYCVRYEDFVADPENVTAALLDFLELPAVDPPEQKHLPRFQLGDATNVYEYDHARPELADHWAESLRDPQLWRWTRNYLGMLGDRLVSELGYVPDSIRETLDSIKPIARYATVPLRLALSNVPSRRSSD